TPALRVAKPVPALKPCPYRPGLVRPPKADGEGRFPVAEDRTACIQIRRAAAVPQPPAGHDSVNAPVQRLDELLCAQPQRENSAGLRREVVDQVAAEFLAEYRVLHSLRCPAALPFCNADAVAAPGQISQDFHKGGKYELWRLLHHVKLQVRCPVGPDDLHASTNYPEPKPNSA